MTPKVTGVDHVHVFVPDRLAAEAWYHGSLGWCAPLLSNHGPPAADR